MSSSCWKPWETSYWPWSEIQTPHHSLQGAPWSGSFWPLRGVLQHSSLLAGGIMAFFCASSRVLPSVGNNLKAFHMAIFFLIFRIWAQMELSLRGHPYLYFLKSPTIPQESILISVLHNYVMLAFLFSLCTGAQHILFTTLWPLPTRNTL